MTPRSGIPAGIRRRLVWTALLAGVLGGSAGVRAADRSEEVAAVFAAVHHGYQRTQLLDGSCRAETYTFARGESWDGAIADPSVSRLALADVERMVAPALAGRNYLPARDPAAAQLRIQLSWGISPAPEERGASPGQPALEAARALQRGPGSGFDGPDSASATPGFDQGLGPTSRPGLAPERVNSAGRTGDAESRIEQLTLARGAAILGYADARDPELRRPRYFVVLLAFDNRPGGNRPGELLWEARISVSELRDGFTAILARLAASGSPYFGQSSGSLVHLGVPAGRVEIGEVRPFGDLGATCPAALAPDGAHVAYLRNERRGRRVVIVDLDHVGHVAYGDVPNLGAVPTEFAWSDASHLRLSLSSNEAYSFDATGRRTAQWLAPARLPPAPDHPAVAAAAAGKFPHRTVAIRGWDQTADRFLLEVSGGPGGSRYYVFDRPTDLVIDLGWGARAP